MSAIPCIVHGNSLLSADAEALVNAVNTEGTMGKGIALQFARAFPEILPVYEAACRSGELRPGKVQVIERAKLLNPRWIVNFPTKRQWRHQSRLEDIDAGLADLVSEVRRRGIRSIALPALGCGLGGLSWEDVRPRIEAAFAPLSDVRALLFAPLASADPCAPSSPLPPGEGPGVRVVAERDASTVPHPNPSPGGREARGRYEHLSRDQLVRLLERRDAERQLGLVWERPGDGVEADAAINEDFVALEFDAALSHGEAPYRNLIVEGDNYDALRYLRMTHAGKIRCIYIDPPYNTGNRDFVYNDRFVDKSHRFRHSLWLEFMYRRLTLARDLLADDGVIFVSIDDNELFRLGMLMDRVFGEQNKVACLVWQTDGNFDNQAKIKVCHEYVLLYARNSDLIAMPALVDPNVDRSSKLFRQEVRNTIVKNGPKNPVSEITLPTGFPADFDSGIVRARTDKWPHLLGDAVVRSGALCNPVVLRSGWANRQQCKQFIDGGFAPILDSKKQSTTFALTRSGAIENIKVRSSPSHVISVLRNLGSTQADGASLQDMSIAFTYPKPLSLLQYLLAFVNDKNAVILDFFAGSGTTAQAVEKLNAEDGGNRRFILVSSTERTDEAPDKNLCRDVCAERVRRVMRGYTNAKGVEIQGLGGGFAYLRARRVPKHRLARRLGHDEIWNALQLLHDLPLQPERVIRLVLRDDRDRALAYLPEWHEGDMQILRDWCAANAGRAIVVYTWTPPRLADLPAQVECRPIPESLRLRFGGAKS
ncbi:MAG: macro domain-containing protein [Xanthomonadales bacterium]|nr:macro domain-containing protein [Xanthomonadales bacterium]